MISNSQKSPRAAKQGRVASVNLAVSWGFCLNPISSQWVRSEIVDDLGFSGLVVAPLLLWILVMKLLSYMSYWVIRHSILAITSNIVTCTQIHPSSHTLIPALEKVQNFDLFIYFYRNVLVQWPKLQFCYPWGCSRWSHVHPAGEHEREVTKRDMFNPKSGVESCRCTSWKMIAFPSKGLRVLLGTEVWHRSVVNEWHRLEAPYQHPKPQFGLHPTPLPPRTTSPRIQPRPHSTTAGPDYNSHRAPRHSTPPFSRPTRRVALWGL